MEQTRVLIVDDHEMVAQGLASALDAHADIDVVGIVGSVLDAKCRTAELDVDVVVMDYRLPDGDGVSATVGILADHPAIAVVMLTAANHHTILAAAIEAGCSAFVTKERAARDLVAAVRAAARGDVAFPRSALAALRDRAGGKRNQALSQRELEVLRLLADGASTDDIAGRLFLSRNTVRNHVQNILGKLGVNSKLQAVVTALREGIVDYPS